MGESRVWIEAAATGTTRERARESPTNARARAMGKNDDD